MRAYVLITAKPGTSEQILKALEETRTIEGVVQADSVYGQYDAIVVIEAPSLDEISHIIYNIIEKIPNIIHTETALTVFQKK